MIVYPIAGIFTILVLAGVVADPDQLPTASLSIYDVATETQLSCLPASPGETVSFTVAVNAVQLPATVRARSWDAPNCAPRPPHAREDYRVSEDQRTWTLRVPAAPSLP